MLSITHILCPIDFSDTSRRAVRCAIALARWYEAKLSVLHVFASVPVVDAVLRRAACPVLIVPPHADDRPVSVPFKRIVCPVDFSSASLAAVRFALTLAQEDDAEITLVHSVEIPPELREYAFPGEIDIDALHAVARADALTRLRDLVPDPARDFCSVRAEATEGRPHRAVVRLAAERHADLIVMGAHGRSALDRLVFGSNTYAVIRDATCPVLAVHVVPAGN